MMFSAKNMLLMDYGTIKKLYYNVYCPKTQKLIAGSALCSLNSSEHDLRGGRFVKHSIGVEYDYKVQRPVIEMHDERIHTMDRIFSWIGSNMNSRWSFFIQADDESVITIEYNFESLVEATAFALIW